MEVHGLVLSLAHDLTLFLCEALCEELSNPNEEAAAWPLLNKPGRKNVLVVARKIRVALFFAVRVIHQGLPGLLGSCGWMIWHSCEASATSPALGDRVGVREFGDWFVIP
jgi:hypothetical protein